MPFVKVCLLEQVYSNEFQRGHNFIRLENCNHSEINKSFSIRERLFFYLCKLHSKCDNVNSQENKNNSLKYNLGSIRFKALMYTVHVILDILKYTRESYILDVSHQNLTVFNVCKIILHIFGTESKNNVSESMVSKKFLQITI